MADEHLEGATLNLPRGIPGRTAMLSGARRVATDASDDAETIGRLAGDCLRLEIDTYPKPGLVSYRDCGAHRDMDAALLVRSADLLVPYFIDLAAAGAAGEKMSRLRQIGLAAEAAMLACTGGVNTHRGAIFGLGLLVAAAGLQARYGIAMPLGQIVANRWGQDILAGPVPLHSHGAIVARRYSAGGARAEAARGFPAVFHAALPALRKVEASLPNDPEASRVQACMVLIATVDDTNLLYRGGPQGLAFARACAAGFLAGGGVARPGWRRAAGKIHASFVARNLSPGGCADLLAMTLFAGRRTR
jgi:triphosphoribosyl-dephospho-CoA synthase